MVIVPQLKTRSRIGRRLCSYKSSLVSVQLKVLSKLKVWFSINFVTPSTLNLHSWTVKIGLETETTSISPFSRSFWNIGLFLMQTLIFSWSAEMCCWNGGMFLICYSTKAWNSASTLWPSAAFCFSLSSRFILASSIRFLLSSLLFLSFSISSKHDDFLPKLVFYCSMLWLVLLNKA